MPRSPRTTMCPAFCRPGQSPKHTTDVTNHTGNTESRSSARRLAARVCNPPRTPMTRKIQLARRSSGRANATRVPSAASTMTMIGPGSTGLITNSESVSWWTSFDRRPNSPTPDIRILNRKRLTHGRAAGFEPSPPACPTPRNPLKESRNPKQTRSFIRYPAGFVRPRCLSSHGSGYLSGCATILHSALSLWDLRTSTGRAIRKKTHSMASWRETWKRPVIPQFHRPRPNSPSPNHLENQHERKRVFHTGQYCFQSSCVPGPSGTWLSIPLRGPGKFT